MKEVTTEKRALNVVDEKKAKAVNGWLMLFVIIFMFLAAIALIIVMGVLGLEGGAIGV